MGNRPIKTYRSGNISGAIWLNEREVNGTVVGFKTVSMRRSWKDKEKDIWRDEVINLRRQDLPKLRVILANVENDLFLAEEEEEDE